MAVQHREKIAPADNTVDSVFVAVISRLILCLMARRFIWGPSLSPQ